MIVGVIVVQTQISRSDSTCNILWKSGAGDCYCCSRYTGLLDSDSEEYGDWRERRLDRIAHLLSVRLRVRLTFPEEDSEDSTAYLLCRSRRLLLLCCAVTAVLCCYCYTTRLWLFQITEITRKAVWALSLLCDSLWRLLSWRVWSLACCCEEPALWRLLSWMWWDSDSDSETVLAGVTRVSSRDT